MTKIRKYQPGGLTWTPNYNGIQSSFGKYGLMQTSLLGDFNTLKTPSSLQLQTSDLGLSSFTNPSAAPAGNAKSMGNMLLSDIRNLDMGNGTGLSGRAARINNRIQGSKQADGTSKWSDAKLQKKTDQLTAMKQADGSFKGGVSNMSSGLQSGLSAAGGMLGGIGAGMNDKLDPNVLQARESIRGAISSMGPIGAIIGAASGVVDMIGDATGLGLDSLDKNSAERAGLKGAAAANNFIAAAPGVGLFAGLAAGKTKTGYKSETVDEYRNAYSGTAGDIDASVALGGKRTLFGKKKANKYITAQNERNKLITGIGLENNLRKNSTYGEEIASQNQNLYAGRNAGSNMVIGKLGMRFPALEEARKILKNSTLAIMPIESEIEKFAEGGKMNVIAQGALHSRKNHLDEVHENLSDVTPKGIPVVSLEEGGEFTQHAEIEGGELVLTKELTSKLEELYKDGSEEAMIEAGKLLAEEIIENTDDKTNEILNDEDND